MKKIMNFVLMAVLAVCFVLPAAGKAEAAKLHGRDHGYV